MLIKVYTTSEDLHIIENVKDVSVIAGDRIYNPDIPDDSGFQTLVFDKFQHSVGHGAEYLVREIRFANDGPYKVIIANKAYICNNDGKTLEKVIVGPQVV